MCVEPYFLNTHMVLTYRDNFTFYLTIIKMFYVYQLGTEVLNELLLQHWQPYFHSGNACRLTDYFLEIGDFFKSPVSILPTTIRSIRNNSIRIDKTECSATWTGHESCCYKVTCFIKLFMFLINSHKINDFWCYLYTSVLHYFCKLSSASALRSYLFADFNSQLQKVFLQHFFFASVALNIVHFCVY